MLIMENKHKKKRRIHHINSNNYYRNFPSDNSKYIKVLIIIAIYVIIGIQINNFL